MSLPTTTPEEIGPTPAPRKRRRGGILIRLLIYVAGLYVTWCVLLYFYQDHLLFPAEMAPEPAPGVKRYDKDTSVITIDIDGGGKNVGWFIPAITKNRATVAPVVIFFHGNAEIIDYLDEIVEPYRRMGFSVFLPEYRGYGRASGKPDEAGLIADATHFYDELIKRPDVDRNRIVIHARSLGGGPATALAAQRPSRALILQSVFTSTADMANRYGAPGFVARNPFHNDWIIPTLTLPILIAHGNMDDVVPFWQGKKLASLAKNAKFLEYPCNHNGFPGDGKEEEYWNEIAAFLRRAGVLDESAK